MWGLELDFPILYPTFLLFPSMFMPLVVNLGEATSAPGLRRSK